MEQTSIKYRKISAFTFVEMALFSLFNFHQPQYFCRVFLQTLPVKTTLNYNAYNLAELHLRKYTK